MSLATTGGGLGGAAGGGLVMAHQVHSVNLPPQPPPQANTTGATAPPPSAAFLGADLLDKSQGLTLRNVKNVAHLPLVAVDLHGTVAHVALFPKKPDDPSKGVPPVAVSKLRTDLLLRTGEASHKSLRKYLSKSKSFASFQTDCWTTHPSKDAVLIQKPHLWLGLRRMRDAPDVVRGAVPLVEDDTPNAIAEEALQGVGAVVANGSLDGSPPTGDDFDRIVFTLRLHDSKKATTMLPEEAVEMLLHQAKWLVAAKVKAEQDDDEIADFPVALALPAWAFHDAAVEALLDAVPGSVLVQRNVAALAGALLPSLDGTTSLLLERLNAVHGALQRQHQKRLVQHPDAMLEEEMTLLVLGINGEGVEMTAIQISALNMENISCLFGIFKVLSNVSLQDCVPISRLSECATQLEAAVNIVAPEADGPAAIILCGTSIEQKQILTQWEKVKNAEWAKVPVFTTPEDGVAKGAAVLGAVAHGRLSQVQSGGSGSQKARASLALRVQNVAPVALGIQRNYAGNTDDHPWNPVEVMFDFDRQIPAGPKSLDLSAAECAVHRERDTAGVSEEEFLKLVKAQEGAKGIPKREEAALQFRVRIVQKWTRDGAWKQVGDIMEPLVKSTEQKDGSTTRVGCERVTWELSLGVTGMITTAFVGERYVDTLLPMLWPSLVHD
jgi:hypothetical protein